MEPARKVCLVDSSLQATTKCTADMKQPPQFLLEWIFSYLSLTNVLSLCLVSKYWHCATIHMLHTRNSLDLQFKALTPNILVFLVGLAQHVTCLRKLCISGEQWEEKHAGVLGLLLLKNQQLREIEFTGPLHHSILREIVKYCENLERLWKTDTTETEKSETDTTEKTKGGVPVDGWLLASLLSGCPHLAQLRIGGVRYTRAPPPTPPESFQLLPHSDIQVVVPSQFRPISCWLCHFSFQSGNCRAECHQMMPNARKWHCCFAGADKWSMALAPSGLPTARNSLPAPWIVLAGVVQA